MPANAALSIAANLQTDRRVKALQRDVAGVRIVRIPRSDHAIFLTNPDEVIDAITTFMRGAAR